MECGLYDFNGYDLHKVKQDEEIYLLHFYFEPDDIKLSGKNIGYE